MLLNVSRTSELRVNQLSQFLGRAIKLKPENGRTRSEPSKEASLKSLNPKVQAVGHQDSPYPEHPVLSLIPSLSQHSHPCFLPFYLLYLGLYHVGQKAQKRLVTLGTLHFLFLLLPFKGYYKTPKQKSEKETRRNCRISIKPESSVPCARLSTSPYTMQ